MGRRLRKAVQVQLLQCCTPVMKIELEIGFLITALSKGWRESWFFFLLKQLLCRPFCQLHEHVHN